MFQVTTSASTASLAAESGISILVFIVVITAVVAAPPAASTSIARYAVVPAGGRPICCSDDASRGQQGGILKHLKRVRTDYLDAKLVQFPRQGFHEPSERDGAPLASSGRETVEQVMLLPRIHRPNSDLELSVRSILPEHTIESPCVLIEPGRGPGIHEHFV